MARRKANTAARLIPINRKGNEINQINGSNARDSKATGQQSTNKTHHPMNRIITFI
jgi:hypothetical protein